MVRDELLDERDILGPEILANRRAPVEGDARVVGMRVERLMERLPVFPQDLAARLLLGVNTHGQVQVEATHLVEHGLQQITPGREVEKDGRHGDLCSRSDLRVPRPSKAAARHYLEGRLEELRAPLLGREPPARTACGHA